MDQRHQFFQRIFSVFPGQVPSHELSGSFSKHEFAIQEPAPLRFPKNRLYVRDSGKEARSARLHPAALW